MKKRLIALTVGILFTITSSTLAMSAQQAKNMADTYVPDDAHYSILMNDKKDFIFYYQSDTDNYKVKFDKKNEFVRALYIEKINPPQSTSVKLSDIDAMKLLEELYPDSTLTHIARYQENDRTFYNMEFTFPEGHGDINVLALDGTILDTTLYYNQ